MKTHPAKIFASFTEAERVEREEHRTMTPAQRLELVSQLRALRHGPDDSTTPRMERVCKIVRLVDSD